MKIDQSRSPFSDCTHASSLSFNLLSLSLSH